ncbi:Esterase FE4 [Eumeta japonica]|uniref:Esterase FE4 n=1 Tax=Eumeta variegata TaxID=151549 RepID=A0A4C1T4P8_EUMVA|nr:Esterase FE4 [Eumeta japonica]
MSCDCSQNIEIKLNQGELSGLIEETFLKKQSYYAFRGIPYALPPLQELRFVSPRPHNGWDGVYEAHETKPTCVQFNSRMRNNEPFGLSGKEDCLYLSVFTPNLTGSRAIIVFDFHDYFRTGFNGTKTYSPDFFIEEDVISVYISHRLSIFGYLSTQDDVIPGNAGVKDFILGLRWIQENIDKFGGDPKRVTVMGSNGAADMVNLLLYSEKAKGLFSGVTIQSGSIMEAKYFPKNPREIAFRVGEVLNITADDSATLLEELKNVEVEKLISMEHLVIDDEEIKSQQVSVLPFSPTLEHDHEDAVIKLLPESAHIVNDVPTIIGYNSREGIDFCSHYLLDPKLYEAVMYDLLVHFPIRTNYRFNITSPIYEKAVEEVKQYYFTNGEISLNNLLEYTVFIADVIRVYAAYYAVGRLASEAKSPVYYYVFDFGGSFNENMEGISKYSRYSLGNRGATAADELCYTLLCSRIHRNYKEINDLPSEQREMKVLKRMVRLWTNFAKTGDPTPRRVKDHILGELIWRPANGDGGDGLPYLHVSRKLEMKLGPFAERMKFWDEFLARYSLRAVDGLVGGADAHRDEL